MNAVVDSPGLLSPVERACLIRAVEERLLRLFAEGKVAGTTHTCIGQELSAVMLAASLDPSRDVIVSNHRCHGHYVAWTDAFCTLTDSRQSIVVYQRSTGTFVRLRGASFAELYVHLSPQGLVALGGFGARSLVDPHTLQFVATLPLNGGDTNWSPNYHFAGQGYWGGHGGLCP